MYNIGATTTSPRPQRATRKTRTTRSTGEIFAFYIHTLTTALTILRNGWLVCLRAHTSRPRCLVERSSPGDMTLLRLLSATGSTAIYLPSHTTATSPTSSVMMPSDQG